MSRRRHVFEVLVLWISRSYRQLLTTALSITAVSLLYSSNSIAQSEHAHVRLVEPQPGQVHNARPARLLGQAVVNFSKLAHQQELAGPSQLQVRALIHEELEEPEEPLSALSPGGIEAPVSPFAASPIPSSSFMGLDDIPMVDSSYIVIPPDVGGAVGLTRIMSGLNNNYRIFNKSDGSVISTVGTATFWAPSGETALNGLTDPRTLYDPFNNRWIAVMQTVTSGAGNILIGVSQTSDPSGNWYLYRFGTGFTIDFPIVGFNKNWISVAINRYGRGGTFQRGITLVVDYPLARTGTGAGTIFTQGTNTHFCSAPCVTYSASSDTLYVVTHLSSSSATYTLDTITGTPSGPDYTAGGSQTRSGGGWVQPSGQLLPQSAPNSGTSSCGGTPCVIETQDSQIRSAPVYRGGFIYYTQTVGLPSGGLTHTGVQWTKLDTPSGGSADGGRLEDPTATSTNGGKWYAFPHIAVNSTGDFMVGYSQFSSAQHPSAGYSMHLSADASGTIRDPVLYKAGEDYYHKDFGSGRNRWGDFSQAQVDPSDDQSLWTVQEYAKNRVNTNDGATGTNGSRWSTYWANVAGPPPMVTIAPGPNQSEGNGGLAPFAFTVNLSTGYSLAVTVNYQTSDGTATVADNDYQSASGSIIIPAGDTSGTITVNAVGDTKGEPDETFSVELISATHGVIGSPGSSTGTIINDDDFTITAAAGTGGSISPSGAVSVVPGASQSFTIAPDPGYMIADVLVDGVSASAVGTYTFTNVVANHTIAASFVLNSYIITASADAGGSISPSGAVSVVPGASQSFTVAPDTCHTIADVLVDGVSASAVGTYTFTAVSANHTIAASFAVITYTITASASAGGSISPSGAVSVDCGSARGFTIAADSSNMIAGVLVDSTSVGVLESYTFTNITTDHTIEATFQTGPRISIGDVIAVEGNSGTTEFAFPVKLSVPGTMRVDVTWQTADSTATASGGDYVSESAVASFPVGVTSGFIPVQVVGDLTPENRETFRVNLSNPVHGTIADSRGVGIILNDDGATAVAIGLLTEVSFALEGGNPSWGAAIFRLGLPASARVELSIYDVAGRRVGQPLNGVLPAGSHKVAWNGPGEGSGVASGVYFARFTAEGRAFTRRFVLLK